MRSRLSARTQSHLGRQFNTFAEYVVVSPGNRSAAARSREQQDETQRQRQKGKAGGFPARARVEREPVCGCATSPCGISAREAHAENRIALWADHPRLRDDEQKINPSWG